jgi:hypothetical protein
VRSGDGDGTVTAQAGPSGPGPAGPNTGGGAGPTTGPAGPGTGGTGGGSGGSGGGGGGLPGGGGGGGGGGATPTPPPTGGPCPSTFTVDAQDTPRLLSEAVTDLDHVFPPDLTVFEDCYIKEVRITLYVTTATGFSGLNETPEFFLGHCGQGFSVTGGGFSGCSATEVYAFSTPDDVASGNRLGTNCSNFAFDTEATIAFDPSAVPPPYFGTYNLDPTRSGIGRFYNLTGLELDIFGAFGHPPDAVLECARIEITTQPDPFPS